VAPTFFTQAAQTEFTPQVDIPGSAFQRDASVEVSGTNNVISRYIAAVYNYGIAIVGIIAAVVLIWGGTLWLTAGGNASRVGEAQEWIKAALVGLILALLSFTILQTISPSLVNLSLPTITSVQPATLDSLTNSLDASTAQSNNLDHEAACGVYTALQPSTGDSTQFSGQRCGTQCPNNQRCRIFSGHEAGGVECPPGNGTYFRCVSQ
jgi:hypothetical protein